MMLKNSFLADIKENNKRRIWVWIVSSLIWFFYYPAGMALLMSRKKNHNVIDGLTGELAKERLTHAAGGWMSVNSAAVIFVILLAVICAIQGFSYLYHKNKVDLYHSVPVKKTRRFAVIFLNGILIYFVPYLIGMLSALAVAAVNGGMDGYVFRMAALSLLMNLILFAGTYALSVLAVMLTGNLVVAGFAVLIFLVYEAGIRTLLFLLKSTFFHYFSYYTGGTEPFLSSIVQYAKVADELERQNGNIGEALRIQSGAVLVGLLIMAVLTAAAFFCYLKRPSEAAGKPLAFAKTKPVIKILLTVPCALAAGLAVEDIVGDRPTVMVILGMAAAVILGSCVIEVVYELDIRAAFRKKYQMLISGVCVAVIYCIFFFDLIGFDAWIPEEDQLEYAVVMFPYDAGNRNYVDSELNYISSEEYLRSESGITDVEAICELSGKKAEETVNDEDTIFCEVGYHMKNGRTVWRNFRVDAGETQLLDRIVGSPEYKERAYQIYDEELFETIKKNTMKELAFEDGFRVSRLPLEDMDRIRELYLMDLENADYSTFRNEFACGNLIFDVGKQTDRYQDVWFKYEIYPSYTNIIGYLEEKGIAMGMASYAEDIASITVTNYHNEMIEKMAEGSAEDAEIAQWNGDFEVTKTFADQKQIEELTEAVYSYAFPGNWKEPGTFSNDYSVTITYKNSPKDSSYYYEYGSGSRFITDRIPDWVEKETAYK